MKTSRKVLSVIMAFMMLISAFAVSSFAAFPDSAVDLYMSVDKDYYSAGDIVTITVSEKVIPAVGDMRIGGNYAIGYNSSVIEMLKPESQELSDYSFTPIQEGYDESTSTVLLHKDNIEGGDTVDTDQDWNKVTVLSIGNELDKQFSAVAGADLFTFQMKLANDIPNGDYVIGFNKGSFANYNAYVNDVTIGTIMGLTDEDGMYNYGTTQLFSFGRVTIHVGAPAPAGPAVSKAKSQVKMTAISATTVADEFSFRVISKISDSDWDTYFKNTGVAGATTDYITAVGMVAYKGAAAFDAETAKKVVAGTPAENYTAATTDYISKVSDTADAEFGAIIKANHSTLNNDVTYMGFVKYVDASGNAQTIFYETAGTAALSTNYNNIVSAYLAAYPFA